MSNYDKYDQYLAMLDFRDVNPLEAEKIAEKCFQVQAWLVKDLAVAEYKELLQGDSVEMTKSELMVTVPSEFTNADSRKAWVHTRPARRESFEKYAATKASMEYLKRLLRLFDGACQYYGRKASR